MQVTPILSYGTKGALMGTWWELPQHRPGSWVVSKYLLNGISMG